MNLRIRLFKLDLPSCPCDALGVLLSCVLVPLALMLQRGSVHERLGGCEVLVVPAAPRTASKRERRRCFRLMLVAALVPFGLAWLFLQGAVRSGLEGAIWDNPGRF